jgi:hypothetical protein
MFQISKGDFIEPFLEFFIRLIFKAGAKHPHDANQLDFWDILFVVTLILIVCWLLYQVYKKRKQR